MRRLIKRKNFFLKKIFFVFLFFTIFLISFLVRIWNLDKNPAGFFCDEASIGYNAYSILKTGKDEWGVKFPIFFKAFGEYKNPLDIYFTVPFIFIFGLNEFAVRFTSVFFSLLNLIMFYLIGKKIKSQGFGLLLMFIFGIMPWSVHLGRINFEGFQIFIFFFLVFFYFLFLYFKNKKTRHVSLFSVVCGFAGYSYFPARIIVPLFFISIVLFLRFLKKIDWKLTGGLILIYIVISLPLIFHLFFGGLTRWRQVSVFERKDISPVKKILFSYFLHFSLDFLFLKGDINMPGQSITRHSIKGVGQLYLWQLPFIILGAYFLIKKKNKLSFPILLILILYPLPSSLTVDFSPQATRGVIGIVPFTFLTAFGLDYFYDLLRKIKLILIRLVFIFVFLLIVNFSFIDFLVKMSYYPLYSSDFWGFQYGPREIINYFLFQKNHYDEFYMSGEFNGGEIFLKFYDPENLCQSKCKIGDFWRKPEIYNPKKRQLFSLSPEYLFNSKFKDKFKIKKIIYYPNGKEAFYIGEVVF